MNNKSQQKLEQINKTKIEELMEQICSKVKQDGLQKRTHIPRHVIKKDFAPHSTSALHSAELNYLNAQWNLLFPSEITITGNQSLSLLAKIKFHLRRRLRNFILGEYLSKELDYRSNLVRFLNLLTRYVDERDKQIFWQLIEKLDNDCEGMNIRSDQVFNLLMSEFDKDKSRQKQG